MDELLYKTKNAYDIFSETQINEAFDYCEGYKRFIDSSKIERFGVKYSVEMAKKAGFKEYRDRQKYNTGDKIYFVQKNKAVIFAVIGSESLESGFNITAAHVDCPRLDIRPNPLYEEGSAVLLKTHYYGGIKKYQWVTRQLALCGVVCKKDGTTVEIAVGDDENDPVFYISDILPHLGQTQSAKPLKDAITGEALNIVIGSRPDSGAESDKFKKAIMKILNEKYSITEEDFQTAELCAVPAEKARDIGFDRSMIGAFGHDDRVCAYPALTALLQAKNLKKTAVAIFADKEEVGSMGITGLRSQFMDYFLEGLCESVGANKRIAYANSSCISADVSAAFDPNYSDVFEKNNSAYLNCGFVVTKYTGARGKSGASEAVPEFIAKLCGIFDEAGAVYQFAELGKIDIGGGGTVAQFIADKNIEVLDIGVPLLSMHAPYELAAKTDIYSLHLALKSFYEKA